MTKAKEQQQEVLQAKQREAQRKQHLQELKRENALMEEQIKYYQYQLALPKLHADWVKMQDKVAKAMEAAEIQEEVVTEVTTEEAGS